MHVHSEKCACISLTRHTHTQTYIPINKVILLYEYESHIEIQRQLNMISNSMTFYAIHHTSIEILQTKRSDGVFFFFCFNDTY